MKINISKTPVALGEAAAAKAAKVLRQAIEAKGKARLILSTGQSQFETLQALLAEAIDWSKVELFHLDEYIDLPDSHPASFRRYLLDRFISKIQLKSVHLVNGEGDVDAHIKALNEAVSAEQVDLGLIGIGENAHIAFNDPPADFTTEQPYIIVKLDDACKSQQVREGWFPDLDHVPTHAISMSVRQILKCRTIISCVPHAVKAKAVSLTLEKPVSNEIPATILKTHSDVTLFVDTASAASLSEDVIARFS
ncbi:MAG: glucosamine-6-phosphate deaminase [Ruminococcaceae bacterium]|nr:glucosamine-6-phosphate deaminase [Oscillospiraceae bacterium]